LVVVGGVPNRSVLLITLAPDRKVMLWIAIAGSLGIGWLAKILIYRHIFKTSIKDQPINILILIEQVKFFVSLV
jgi:hypothetical protein